MAGRSQLLVQIMENQTRFDLNAAVENWRNELTAQPNLASDDRRELETHLRDAIAGFQQRGLNDEESFWLARKRVGQPQKLSDEFVKNNRTQQEPLNKVLLTLSIASMFLLLCKNTILPTISMNHRANNNMESYYADGFWGWYSFWPNFVNECFLLSLILIVLFSLFTLRRRFVVVTAILFFTLGIVQALVYAQGMETWAQNIVSQGGHFTNKDGVIIQPPTWVHSFWQTFVSTSSIPDRMWFLILIGLIVSLMPTLNQKTPKRA